MLRDPPSKKKPNKQNQESLVVAVMLHEAEVTRPQSSPSPSLKCPEGPTSSIWGEGAAKRARLPWKRSVLWGGRECGKGWGWSREWEWGEGGGIEGDGVWV